LGEYNIFVNIWANFTKSGDAGIRAWDILISSNGQTSRSQQAITRNFVNTISHNPVNRISLSFGHRCIWVRRCVDYLLGS